jgi:hypothetical protein
MPVWLFVTLSADAKLMAVGSLAAALADPPPDTVTALTCCELAVPSTFTVTVMGG